MTHMFLKVSNGRIPFHDSDSLTSSTWHGPSSGLPQVCWNRSDKETPLSSIHASPFLCSLSIRKGWGEFYDSLFIKDAASSALLQVVLDRIFSLFIHCPLKFFLYPRFVCLQAHQTSYYFLLFHCVWCFETDLIPERERKCMETQPVPLKTVTLSDPSLWWQPFVIVLFP